MKNTQLTNINITKRQTSNYSQDYFIIYDNDTNTAYFVFKNKLLDKTLWNNLDSNYLNLKKIWVEYEETEKGYQVINFDILETNNDTDFFI